MMLMEMVLGAMEAVQGQDRKRMWPYTVWHCHWMDDCWLVCSHGHATHIMIIHHFMNHVMTPNMPKSHVLASPFMDRFTDSKNAKQVCNFPIKASSDIVQFNFTSYNIASYKQSIAKIYKVVKFCTFVLTSYWHYHGKAQGKVNKFNQHTYRSNYNTICDIKWTIIVILSVNNLRSNVQRCLGFHVVDS